MKRKTILFLVALAAGIGLTWWLTRPSPVAPKKPKKPLSPPTPRFDADGNPSPGPGYVLQPGFDGKLRWTLPGAMS